MSTKLTRTLGLGAIELSWPTFLVITPRSPWLLLLVSQPLECPRSQSTRTPSPPTLILSLMSSTLVASDTNCMLTASSSRTDQDCPLNPRHTSIVHFDIFSNTSTEHGQPHSARSHGIPGLWDKCASPGAQAEGSGRSHGSNALSLLPSHHILRPVPYTQAHVISRPLANPGRSTIRIPPESSRSATKSATSTLIQATAIACLDHCSHRAVQMIHSEHSSCLSYSAIQNPL